MLFAEFMRRFVSFAEFLRGFSVIYHTRSYRVPRSEEDLLPRTAAFENSCGTLCTAYRVDAVALPRNP